MAASAGGVPEQLEQVRVAQVAHPAASSSAHEVPDNHHGARRAAGPCEVEWRRAWSSSATSPSRLGQSVLSVLHPRQFEGRCFAVRHPDPKCAHASAAPAASCARVSITHVVACLRPPACVAVGRGTPKHLHSTAIDEKDGEGGASRITAASCCACIEGQPWSTGGLNLEERRFRANSSTYAAASHFLRRSVCLCFHVVTYQTEQHRITTHHNSAKCT